MDLDYKLVGKRIRQYRKQLRLTQAKLAEIAGISVQHCSALECGKKAGSFAIYYQISQALNISLDSLVIDSSSNSSQIATSALINRINRYSPEQYKLFLLYMDFLDTI